MKILAYTCIILLFLAGCTNKIPEQLCISSGTLTYENGSLVIEDIDIVQGNCGPRYTCVILRNETFEGSKDYSSLEECKFQGGFWIKDEHATKAVYNIQIAEYLEGLK